MWSLILSIIKKPEKKVHLSFRLDPELIEKLRTIAEKEGVSVTFVLESFLKHGIEAWENEKGVKLDSD